MIFTHPTMFAGVHTALATPFLNQGIDTNSFCALIDRQFENGISGVVPVGTTGEAPTLSHEEHCRVIELAVEHTAKRGLVIAGTGSNATDEAISLTQQAENAGADAALIVAPYYNKPSPEGLFQHFRAIADSTGLPIILYSIPGRCGIEIGVDTVARLANECSNIVALKEAGGSSERVNQLKQALPGKFEILSGDDSLTLPFMSVGAVGVISVAANIIPKEMAQLVAAALDGRFKDALGIHRKYYPLFRALLQLASNPAPIKTALSLAGLCSQDLRLPLVRMPEHDQDILRAILEDLKIV